MNERIRKLAVNSGIDIRGHLTGQLTLDEKPSVADLDKFAELIVKECAKVGGDFEYERLHDSLVEDHILKHFGVDE